MKDNKKACDDCCAGSSCPIFSVNALMTWTTRRLPDLTGTRFVPYAYFCKFFFFAFPPDLQSIRPWTTLRLFVISFHDQNCIHLWFLPRAELAESTRSRLVRRNSLKFACRGCLVPAFVKIFGTSTSETTKICSRHVAREHVVSSNFSS